MRRSPLLYAWAGPGLLTLVGLLFVTLIEHEAWGFVPLGLALITAPLWPFAALIGRGDNDPRAGIVEALNFQLTVIAGLVLGAVLLLFFVGLLVLIGVVIVEIVVSLTAAWNIRNDRPVILLRSPIRFVK